MNHSSSSGPVANHLLRLLSSRRTRWVLFVLAAAAFVRYREWADRPSSPPNRPSATSTSDAAGEPQREDDRASRPGASRFDFSRDTANDSDTAEVDAGEAVRFLEQPSGNFHSPGGLVYAPGSRQGHRLKHVLAHASDQPGRPGPHGVFDDPSPDVVVALLDEAYALARNGDPRARLRRDGERAIWTVDMGRRVGYVGGQAGKRQSQPAAHHLRLVLEDDRVITAYPLIP